MSLFIDLYRKHQLHQAETTPPPPKARFEELDRDDLVRRSEALTLACQALWEIVRDEHAMTDEDILRKMQEIDLRDGALDGRVAPSIATCPACHRGNNAARRVCIYCGAKLPTKTGVTPA